MTPEEHQLCIIHAGVIIIIIIIAYCHIITLEEALHSTRHAIHTSRLTEQQWIQELLSGHEDRLFNEFGMHKKVFKKLLAFLQANAGAHATCYVSAEEQLATFLHYVHWGLSNRALQERF